jgi:hypothetical protein
VQELRLEFDVIDLYVKIGTQESHEPARARHMDIQDSDVIRIKPVAGNPGRGLIAHTRQFKQPVP